ncbi:MAG TPA: head GIN domain-containing protein [Bacteroidales bacterium]|nr:head GIN domain-containing protein [Bacteroidales bacterium]
MKNLRILTIIIAVLVLTTAAYGQFFETVRGNHNVVKKDRNVGSFTGIKVSSGIDVFLKQGNSESLSIEADENLHEYIITEVRDGVLHIYTKSKINIRDAEMKRAYVSMKDIYSIQTTSAGDITGETPIKAQKLRLSTSSAGDIKLEVNADEIEIDISSAGDIKVSGSADKLEADLSSAGNLDAYDLRVREADISVSSAGDADINVSERITARASSAGNINYKGNPKYVDSHSSSAGGIHRR